MFFSTEPLDSRRKTNKRILISIMAAMLTAAFLINPYSGLLSCRFKNVTGLPCPTCGMTRSVYETIHLNLIQAFGYHLFGPLLLFAATTLLFKYLAELIMEKHVRIHVSSFWSRSFFAAFGLAWLGFWMVRLIN